MKSDDRSPIYEIRNLSDVLRVAEPRPAYNAKTEDQIAYAVRFANSMAVCIANGLRKWFPEVLPLSDGRGTESSARAVGGTKKLDINFSTPELGLGLGVSLKSVHFRDSGGSGRYTHNMKRNDEELRVEADSYHRRQPYAVMVAVLFLPFDACDDGKTQSSSFGSWVRKLRPLARRGTPHDESWRFEKVYIALYEPDGSSLTFFDVEDAPPKQGRPKTTIDFTLFLHETRRCFLVRNALDFEWDDGSPDES